MSQPIVRSPHKANTKPYKKIHGSQNNTPEVLKLLYREFIWLE